MNMKTILAAALVALFIFAASEAKADTVWTLKNIELSDGTFLNGLAGSGLVGLFNFVMRHQVPA